MTYTRPHEVDHPRVRRVTNSPPARPGLTRARVVLTFLLAGVAVPTAALTLWDPGLLLGPAAMNGSARGTALVVLVLGVPLVAGAGWVSRHGDPAWLAAAAGGVAFLTYNAVMFVFATPFNRAFLL